MRAMLSIMILLCTATTGALAGSTEEMYAEIHGNGIYTTSEKCLAERKARYFSDDANDLQSLAERTELAIDAMIDVSVRNLRWRGYYSMARELSRNWSSHRGELQAIVYAQRYRGRDIGDFKPLLKFLDDAYHKVLTSLGWEVCYALRLTDIETINHALVVVFQPCQYGASEFGIHACHDPAKPEAYRGLAPVVSYWTTLMTCEIATFQAGLFWICSPLAMLVERIVDNMICPWLAPKIYEASCGRI